MSRGSYLIFQVSAAREPVHQPVEEVLLHEGPADYPGPVS